MNYDDVIASAARYLPSAREFESLFPNAEHSIVDAQRDFDPEGWMPVNEWISRAQLYDRYIVSLVVAIDISADGTLSEIEKPQLYVIEVERVEQCADDGSGPMGEVNYMKFEAGAWKELVEQGGDFAALGLEMRADAPVDRFATYWNKTRPRRLSS